MIASRSEILAYDIIASAYIIVGVALVLWLLTVWCRKRRDRNGR